MLIHDYGLRICGNELFDRIYLFKIMIYSYIIFIIISQSLQNFRIKRNVSDGFHFWYRRDTHFVFPLGDT